MEGKVITFKVDAYNSMVLDMNSLPQEEIEFGRQLDGEIGYLVSYF